MEDARRGRQRATELIEQIVPSIGEEMFLVVHGRWLAHAFGGEATLTGRFLRQVETTTEDDVWRRKVFLFVEAELHALSGDLPRLSRVSDAIAELAHKFAGW